jgi:CMP-N-acetylneuraminic acid synthetase
MIAIIPARGNSKRFPKKNIALLDGKPLLVYAIEAAANSGIFDKIYVSTEDPEIALVVHESYHLSDKLHLYARHSSLSEDTSTVIDVCKDIIEHRKNLGEDDKAFAVLLATNPLRTAEDIRNAYKIFKENKNTDFVMSLAEYEHPPLHAVEIDGYVKPMFPKENKIQSQFLKTMYRHDGAVIFAKTKAFLKTNDFYGERVAPYVMPRERTVDINTPADLKWAEFLINSDKE